MAHGFFLTFTVSEEILYYTNVVSFYKLQIIVDVNVKTVTHNVMYVSYTTLSRIVVVQREIFPL